MDLVWFAILIGYCLIIWGLGQLLGSRSRNYKVASKKKGTK